MKDIFPGYFTPTADEFSVLWKEALFAFDANVLLRLYRSTPETRGTFFGVLEKIRDRIFLPHQAAQEYLNNRLPAISVRAESYNKIASDLGAVAKSIEATAREQGLPNAEEIHSIMKAAVSQMSTLIKDSVDSEPDLLKSDSVLAQVDTFFTGKTGTAYAQQELIKIYETCSRRYSQAVPPGYKDEKKGEPRKYGDAIIWFQLIDRAKESKKPIIFITGDAKEDWWLIHGGDTLGPRPELRQEMRTEAGVGFYMYTAPRFLEFAPKYLGLTVDTKSAESELEKIEMQDRQADTLAPTFAFTTYEPSTKWFGPVYTSTPYTPNDLWGVAPSASECPITTSNKPEVEVIYLQLLPINSQWFRVGRERWKCQIVKCLIADASDALYYFLQFESQFGLGRVRHLTLTVSASMLKDDIKSEYKAFIVKEITNWLGTRVDAGQVTLLP